MTSTGLQNLDQQIQKFNIWLKDLDEKLYFQDRRKSYKTLKIVLHAIRDQLTIEQSAHFSAQLPLIARGLYYEGWQPSRVPKKERTVEEFYAHITAGFDVGAATKIDPARHATAVFELINEHITPGEVNDVRHELPGPIRALWPAPTAPHEEHPDPNAP